MIDKLYIFIISILIIILSGTSNIYPIYLQHLVDKFNFSVNIINLYGSFVTMGGYMGFPIGLITDKFGPKVATFLGTLILSIGYYFLSLILSSNHIENINIVLLLILGFMLGQGNYLLYTSAVGTSLKNFNFKGNVIVLGILLSNTAASPSLFSTCRDTLGNINDSSFYHYLSIFIFSCGMLAVFALNKNPITYSVESAERKFEKYKERKMILFMILYNSFIIVIFIIGILVNYFTTKYSFPLIIIFPILFILNFIFIILETLDVFEYLYLNEFNSRFDSHLKKQEMELSEIMKSNDFLPSELQQNDEIDKNQRISNVQKAMNKNISKKLSSFLESSKEDDVINLKKIVFQKDFIILFIIILFGLGICITNMSNLNFILKSISYKIHYSGIDKGVISIYKSKEVYFYVILYFIFNSLIRIVSAFYLTNLIKKRQIQPYLIIFSCIGLCSQILGYFMEKEYLYVSISLAGAVHGGYVIFIPAFIQMKYGLKKIATLFGIVLTAGGIGSFLISETAFSFPYSYYSKEENNYKCIGKECFSYSYLSTSILFGVNIILSFIINFEVQEKTKINKDK